MLYIRTADKADCGNVRDFYYSMIDAMDGLEHKPLWKKDVYPTPELLT